MLEQPNITALSTLVERLDQLATKTLSKTPNLPFHIMHDTIYKEVIKTDTTNILYKKSRAYLCEKLSRYTLHDPLLKTIHDWYEHDTYQHIDYQPTVAIIGAGLAGLYAAFVLAHFGANITLYEKRSEVMSRIRYQNISFKEAESLIKPILGEIHYQTFFNRGGSLDGNTAKLRATTGTFQDIIIEALKPLPVTFHYETELSKEAILQLRDDIVLIAAGTHSCDMFQLHDMFHPHLFPHYQVKGRTALCIAESHAPHGYHRFEREGYHWRRENITVYPTEAFQPDITRVTAWLEKTNAKRERIQYVQGFLNAQTLEYTFTFGNDTPRFLEGKYESEDYCIDSLTYTVLPMITDKIIAESDNSTLVLIGDANGSPHPLAAIGTLKFLRNALHLRRFVFCYSALKHYQYYDLLDDVKQVYEYAAHLAILEVFIGNILSCVFSRPRD